MAKLICTRCFARVQCLIAALEGDHREGIWGGIAAGHRRVYHQQYLADPDGDTFELALRAIEESDQMYEQYATGKSQRLKSYAEMRRRANKVEDMEEAS